MAIYVEKDGSKLNVRLDGRLDTTTAPELDKEVMANIENVNDIVLDLTDLVYMSSAGLRVVLSCQKKMNAVEGQMIVKNPNELIMEIFESTGFVDFLTIEAE